MKPVIFLVIWTIIAGEVVGRLDFSQFYLPPCCYTSPQDNFSGYASKKANVNTKREATTFYKKVILHSGNNNASENEISENINKKKFIPVKKYFKLNVPLKEILLASASDLTKPTSDHKPNLTMGKIMLQNNQHRDSQINPHKSSNKEAIRKSKLLEKIFTIELDTLESNKQIVGKKSLGQKDYEKRDEDLRPEHRSEFSSNMTNNSTDSKPAASQIVETYHRWEPQKLITHKDINRSLRLDVQKIPLQETNGKNTLMLQNSPSETVNRQFPKKMPSSWVKHLKRALYQSITTTKEGSGGSEDTERFPPSDPEIQNRYSTIVKQAANPLKFPETWNLLKSAELQFVDPMSQTSDTHREIYLPPGEGPVVSGVLVNTNTGEMKVRISSELYYPNTDASNQLQKRQDNCHCHLLNPGEILVAYWSISRIYNDNGLPALQYLVYPLPHSVPTAPQLLPFSNAFNMFSPSPIDPLTKFYENIHRTNAIAGPDPSQAPIYPSYPPPPPPHQQNFGNFNPTQNYPEENNNPALFSQGFNPDVVGYNNKDIGQAEQGFYGGEGQGPPPRNPKLVHELSNGHHRLEVLNNNQAMHEILHEAHPSPIPPTPPQLQQQFGNEGQLYNENTKEYAPEFVERYNQELQNYFLNQQVQNLQNNGGGGKQFAIPYMDLNMNNGPINYFQQQMNLGGGGPTQIPVRHQGPGSTGGSFENIQNIIQQLPLQQQQPEAPAAPPNANPTGLPVHDSQFQLQKPPTFPNSIQDIISPVPQTEEELRNSPRPQQQQIQNNVQSGPFPNSQPGQQQQPIPVIPSLPPPPYFLNPPGILQNYVDDNMLHNLNLLQFQLYNQQNQQGQPLAPPQQQLQQQLMQPYVNFNLQGAKQSEQTQSDKDENNNKQPDKQDEDNGSKNQVDDDQSKNPPSSSYVIQNVRDNEKKYYPVMNRWKSRHHKYFERSYPNRIRKLHKAYDIGNKSGYILDF